MLNRWESHCEHNNRTKQSVRCAPPRNRLCSVRRQATPQQRRCQATTHQHQRCINGCHWPTRCCHRCLLTWHCRLPVSTAIERRLIRAAQCHAHDGAHHRVEVRRYRYRSTLHRRHRPPRHRSPHQHVARRANRPIHLLLLPLLLLLP